MTEVIYSQSFRVRAYEMDSQGLAKPETLLNYLQEAAAQHAHRLGFSVLDLNKKNLTWVLSRYHILIHRYPAWGSEVSVRTWPAQGEGLFAIRDFEASDEEGPFAAATSSWMVLDLSTKKPVSVGKNLPEYPLHEERVLDDPFLALPGLDRIDQERSFTVLQNDLDFNRHVNNAVYIRWGLEGVPKDVLLFRRPQSIEITYRKQVFYGDIIQSRIQKSAEDPEGTFFHQIYREKDGQELARLRTVWR